MNEPATLLVREHDGVAHLTLNRPAQRNALDIPLLTQLQRELGRIAADSGVRAVILTGAGTAFCAGADLAEWAAAEARGALETYGWTELAHQVMVALHTLNKPTIAAVNGSAVGAGMDLALCCDFRVAGRSAKFRAGYTRMAYTPDAGASWHLPRLIGEQRACELLFLDEPWDAERARESGLVGSVCSDQELAAAAGALGSRLAVAPTFAIAQTKQLLRDSRDRTLAEQLAVELQAGVLCGRTEDAAEALKAVAERRAPSFIGS
jgi:2-(1,2-epoxy-1,2-dihydrophenyl)acetyl-CoA isomerase